MHQDGEIPGCQGSDRQKGVRQGGQGTDIEECKPTKEQT